jgi:hypothetical protein
MHSLPQYEWRRAVRHLWCLGRMSRPKMVLRDDESNLMRLLAKWVTTKGTYSNLQEKG